MSGYYGYEPDPSSTGFLANLPPPLRAALFVALGLIVLDIITFVTAGTGAALSWPLLALVYIICGALSARFSADARDGNPPVVQGAKGGGVLWVISFLVNAILSLILSVPSLGLSLLAGVPFLCICGPVELIGGGILGSFGGLIYGLISSRGSGSSDNPYW